MFKGCVSEKKNFRYKGTMVTCQHFSFINKFILDITGPPQYFADQLTLFRPGEHIMPITLMLRLQNFGPTVASLSYYYVNTK